MDSVADLTEQMLKLAERRDFSAALPVLAEIRRAVSPESVQAVIDGFVSPRANYWVREMLAEVIATHSGVGSIDVLVAAHGESNRNGDDNDNLASALIELVEQNPEEARPVLQRISADEAAGEDVDWLFKYCAPGHKRHSVVPIRPDFRDLRALDFFLDQIDPASQAEWNALSKAEQYVRRKNTYVPGDLVLVPTHPRFGGAHDQFGVAILLSCNWLGLIHLGLVDQWVGDGEPVRDVTPDDVVEAWWGGDAMFLGGVFRSVGAVERYQRQEWPASIGQRPVGIYEGLWESWFSARKSAVRQQQLAIGSGRRTINLFLDGDALATIVRVSERRGGLPLDPWPISGTAPGSIQPFRVPQAW